MPQKLFLSLLFLLFVPTGGMKPWTLLLWVDSANQCVAPCCKSELDQYILSSLIIMNNINITLCMLCIVDLLCSVYVSWLVTVDVSRETSKICVDHQETGNSLENVPLTSYLGHNSHVVKQKKKNIISWHIIVRFL